MFVSPLNAWNSTRIVCWREVKITYYYTAARGNYSFVFCYFVVVKLNGDGSTQIDITHVASFKNCNRILARIGLIRICPSRVEIVLGNPNKRCLRLYPPIVVMVILMLPDVMFCFEKVVIILSSLKSLFGEDVCSSCWFFYCVESCYLTFWYEGRFQGLVRPQLPLK